MAEQPNNGPKMEQIDLTKLNVQQLQQLKTEFEQVGFVVLRCACVGATDFCT